MIIPKLHYIAQGSSSKEYLENIQRACTSGAELVQLRIKDISKKKILNLALEAREITAYFQTRLIISDYYQIAKEVKADGVHFGKTDINPTVARKHLHTWQIIGGTANTLQECESLISKDVDYISLTPFRSSTTEENSRTVLGLNGYVAIVEALNTKTPIIGCGGITTRDVKNILETGVSGIAVSEAITHNFNSIRIFNLLLSASVTKEQRHTFK